jgi:hypothetical protein
VGDARPRESGRRFSAKPSFTAPSFVRVLQILLILIAFGHAFWHGVAIGQDKIGYQPVYRLRQALAIALSRMHELPLGGYLAHGSVVEALSRNGFALFADDVGPRFEADRAASLLFDADRLDRALHDARSVEIDTSRPSQLMLGADVAYADFVYASFVLFGPHFSSMYYFYFLLLGASCLAFVIAFRR